MKERFITYTNYIENIGNVTSIYEGSFPNQLEGFVITTDDPVRMEYPNLEPILRIKLDTKELYYDYISIKNTETLLMETQEKVQILETENQQLIQKQSLMQSALDDLILAGMGGGL